VHQLKQKRISKFV